MEPNAAATSSRRVLRRLRDVMAAPATAQQKLDTVVRIIAAEMVAEVCSCYLRRAGEVLELFATEGLRPEAVHRTRLHVGEGLVGVIAATARPLALADAQTHPNYAYRPETGEEIYHSLLGVPILRGGNVLGVLVVQNRTQRHYDEDEVETLQTIAMVLAEIAASGDLVNPLERQFGEGNVTLPVRLEGIRLNPGLAMGQAVLHQPRIAITQIVAEDINAELERLKRAAASMQTAIDDLLSQSDIPTAGEHQDVLETYRMFASDRGWMTRIADAIRGGLTAEAAVQKVQDDTRARLSQATDPYIRERLADLDDLANRLQWHLTGKPGTASAADLPDEFVLVARNMGPAELLDYDRKRLKGLVLEEGSPGAHVAVVARALDIPVVGRVKNVLAKVEAGDLIAVDGEDALVVLRPTEDIVQAVAARIRIRQGQRETYAALRDLPAETKDGVQIDLQLNAGLLLDLPYLDEVNAGGIGLFRTELQFMLREDFPSTAQQMQLYRRVLEQAGNRPVTFRTLDVGGDKLLPYMIDGEREENPAMGWRAVRVALDRPALLRQQLRAFIRAAAGKRIRIMFPLVADLAEYEAVREMLDLELTRVTKRDGELPLAVETGVMLEVPALIWQLPELLKRVDFISVGTNDLLQFLFAADRGNAKLAERYDNLSPTVLRVLGDIAKTCHAAGKSFSLCGEMAGDPLGAMALIGIGFRCLSMAPRSFGPVKAMIRSLDLTCLREFLAAHDGHRTASLRSNLHAFAQDHGVAV